MMIIEVFMIVILVLIIGIPLSIFLTGILWVIIEIAERIDNFVRRHHSKFEGFQKPICLRQSDFFKMAIDSTIEIREIMQKELDKRYKNTRKDLEQDIDFKGENND
jgi:hypothetical protein